MNELEKVLKQLEDSFADVPMPPEERIVSDASTFDIERSQIRAKFRQRHWRDLSIEDLEGEADALSFFTLEAFRFFLPAFIRVSLLEPLRADLIPDAILGKLARADHASFSGEHKEAILDTFRQRGIPEKVLLDLFEPKEDPELDAVRRARVELLTGDQRKAVKSFVSFLRKHRSEEFEIEELDRVEEML